MSQSATVFSSRLNGTNTLLSLTTSLVASKARFYEGTPSLSSTLSPAQRRGSHNLRLRAQPVLRPGPFTRSRGCVGIGASLSAPTSMSTTTSAPVAREARRFAPLDPSAANGRDLPKLKGIIFDVDGTLCLPQNYMFKEMRAALDIPRSVDILDHIRSLSNEPDTSPATGDEPRSTTDASQPPAAEMLSHSSSFVPDPTPSSPQARAVAKVQAIERRAMTSQRPQPGLQELMAYLTRRGVPKALCTRNFPAPVHHLLGNHVPGEVFHPIITRETVGVQPKPSPEGLWSIAQAWGLHQDADEEVGTSSSTTEHAQIDPLELAKRHLGSGLIMVGDSLDDMAAGHRAGAATVLLANDENEGLSQHEYTGLSIRRLDELIDILENGFAESR